MKSFKQFVIESKIISEGKHWPEDYIKTAKNIIKASLLGQQSWYSDQYIDADLKTFANEFQPLSHKNSNLGFFSPIVKWFVEYSGSDKNKYQEFIEGKLDNIIRTLQQILNDKSYDSQRESIKKMSFKDFEKMMSDILAKSQVDSDAKLSNIQQKDDYELIPIYSYDELHDKFGGKKTGYRGKSTWCHANGQYTYDSNAWTNGGKNMFFVLAKKGWENIKPNKTDNAFDEYGTSLIAILVDVQTNDLKAETLRWNHIIDPSTVNPRSSIDHAFKDSWGELSQLVGFNVKTECEKYCKDLKNKLEYELKNINKKCEELLSGVDEIDNNTIPQKYKSHITSIIIPNSVKSIEYSAFSNCELLKEITIPDSVTRIGAWAFHDCKSLKEIIIPNRVTSIDDWTFYLCKSLQEIVIPNGVTSIGDNAFRYCESLTSITIPNSVTYISVWAFSYCESLTSITIPNSVTSIGNGAFYQCNALTKVIFSSNSPLLNNIKNGAYKNWSLEFNKIFITKEN